MTNQEAAEMIRNGMKLYYDYLSGEFRKALRMAISALQAQSEIIRCKDCEYGEQDEVGRWFCRSLGCQIGDEDGNGFCADGERRADV